MKKVFISAPANVNLSTLLAVLREKGVKPVLSFDIQPTGLSLLESIGEIISDADFFIAVISEFKVSANVFLEVGYALAKRKRIVLIQDQEVQNLFPSNLSGLITFRVGLGDRQKLSLLLEPFLHQPKKTKRSMRVIQKTRPLSSHSLELLKELRGLGPEATHENLERLLVSVFRSSGIQTIAEPKSADREYDLALWIDELQSIVGNPLLVEIKAALSIDDARKLKRHFVKRIDREIGKALMIVFFAGNARQIYEESIGLPLVLFVSVEHLLTELTQKSFGEFIRVERNRLVHGV